VPGELARRTDIAELVNPVPRQCRSYCILSVATLSVYGSHTAHARDKYVMRLDIDHPELWGADGCKTEGRWSVSRCPEGARRRAEREGKDGH
jgi:hypothetical protein